MREVSRLQEPQILIDRKDQWLGTFLTSGKSRPDSSKYAHDTIKTNLNSMSSHKCFYCETKLKGEPKEVDHFIEVSVDKNLAFIWINLNLSCDNCNNKIPHNIIPVEEVLDPCTHDDDFIQQHITFEKEFIEPKDNSDLGLRSIKKYRLDSEQLDTRRLKQISLFQDLLLEIKSKQIAENRQDLSADEINLINSFKRIDKPYSLMFIVLLRKYGL